MKYEGKIKKVIKRDGRVVDFDVEKITNAIFKAAKSVGGSDRAKAEELTNAVMEAVEQKYEVPTVEELQDTVEKVLIEKGHAKTAKAYILYREQHKKIREMESIFVDVDRTIGEYLSQEDWRTKENSNTDFSFSGLMLHTAGKVIAKYTLNNIYTPTIREAHELGYYHIHDLGHGIVAYCAGWSLKNLLLMGFGNVPNKVDTKPAKHMDVCVSQMVNYIGCLQMEFAGAQAFSSVDTLLAPFVRADGLDYEQVKQSMQRLVFSLNIPSRWGSQMPFSNLTFDLKPPKDMEDEKAIIGGEPQPYTYGDCQDEMDMINRGFLEVMGEGDAKGRIFTFPIPTYNITKDFEWNSEISELLFEVTAKYGLPYFQNYAGSNLDPGAIRAMCCRLNIDQRELMNRPGSIWGPGDSTGSIGVVTINLNRLGFEAKGHGDVFFEKLSHYMELAKDSLEIKRRVVTKNLKNGLMPYTKAYLGSFENHFSTIGIVGMHEALKNMYGFGIDSPEGKAFTIKTLKFIREKLKDFQEETESLYNLEATPAESAAYRLARLDRRMYPEIMVAGDKEPMLTNSTQLPVNKTDDVLYALEHQNEIQPLYTGGTIFHTFVGERLSNGSMAKMLVKKISNNTKLPYFSITPTFSICKKCGYVAGEHPTCPKCGKETEVYSRIVGYFRPLKNWNAGKKDEFRLRKTYAVERDAMKITGWKKELALEKAKIPE